MATTTNYGWTTPDDTSLVKDGAAAIRTLGSSVDTTTKALNPSTTLGDIEYRSSTANTNTRLGIGTTGQVLTVSGGVPTWATASAGGWTLISTTSLASLGSATLSLTSIPQTYKNLHVLVNDAWIITTDGEITFGQNSNAGNNYGGTWGAGGSGISNVVYSGKHKLTNNLELDAATYPSFDCQISIFNYTSADSKMITSATHFARQSFGYTGALSESSCQVGAAISSVQLVSAGGNWNGGTVRLYGEA